ncbi:MAG: topoisomerase C-terminal repeat-containing protein [Clostridia bacterium]|nr:topoisomerase C-terminal repeat-containing protein [Clostridia bacterium]
MIAIIAEKPGLARNIVAGIGKMDKKNGFFINDEYIVTWAFGHLFSLCDVEDYSENADKNKGWTMEGLPCFPEKFNFKLKDDASGGVARQFNIIRQILNRDDVDCVVNAGDADREGEIIVRLCVIAALDKDLPFKRLWLPDQTPQTVADALKNMKDEREYDALSDEGFARTYIDWLYGVNLTRFASLKTGSLLRVGRVIVPIVKAIYDRDREIENFKPQIYYALVSRTTFKGEETELCSKYQFPENDKRKAEICCQRMNLLEAVVTDKKSKKEKVPAGKLYSLSKLQNHLGKKYKMPMEKSLALTQALYEKGFVSYPRTNSEYLAVSEKEKIRKNIADLKRLGYPVIFKDGRNIFDDSKIESHSALTITYKIPDKNQLSPDEKIVYSAILRRFVAVFCIEDCVMEKTEITISLGGKEDYLLKGSSMISPGWTKFDGLEKKDKLLPPLNVGDKIPVDFHPEQKQTSPPKHYTIETLNNYLKNPFKDEKSQSESDDEDYKAIFKGLELGTEATRTGIIENARKNGYISLKKDVYHIENTGKFLIEQLSDMNISMDKYKTSELGQALKKVYRGEISISDSVDIAKKEISRVFDLASCSSTGFFGDEICDCPKCGSKIVRNKYAYACKNAENCDFKVNLRILNRSITKNDVAALAEKGKTSTLEFISKTGKAFKAKLSLDEQKKVVFDFDQTKPDQK